MKVEKSYEITDAKISFVSLVDKAANKKQFLITKAEKGHANFATYGRILKVDSEHHYITGVVYEPMEEDSHGNFMTEEEIVKAAYWFAKNGDKVDLQHSFEELPDAVVVETWVAKSDMVIEGEEIKKGTWLMTVEISDPDVWEKVQKKEITGFSMGGVGKYSDEDVNLNNVEKGDGKVNADTTEKKGILKKLAEAFGLDVVEKGAMTDRYNASIKSTRFWTAFNVLEDLLYKYNWQTDRWEYEGNESIIKEALEEFSAIITEVLSEQSIVKALGKPVTKAGKKMSSTNKTKLDEIVQALNDFSSQFNDASEEDEEVIEKSNSNEKGDDTVKPDEIKKMIQEEIKKALEPAPEKTEKVNKEAAEDTVTKADIKSIIAEEIKKALGEQEEEAGSEDDKLTKEAIADVIRKELSSVLKARGIASNLNDQGDPVEKSDTHYLKGII